MERTLRKVCGLGLGLALVVAFSIQVCAQKDSPPHSAAPLVLTGAIPLPNVKGRIDHFAFDATHNGSSFPHLETIRKRLLESVRRQLFIRFLECRPRKASPNSPETNKLFVGSDEGKLYVYDGTTFDLITSIDFGDDVDNLRYDAAEKRLYVGYGNDRFYLAVPARAGHGAEVWIYTVQD
jgi:hypothetical protein